MLTRKQHELLLYIDEQISINGVSPSFDEMKEALGLKSKSGIHRLISALEERGFLRRLPHRARALEVIRRPEDLAKTPARGGFQPSVIEGGRTLRERNEAGRNLSVEERSVSSGGQFREIPMMSKIAAGLPIEAAKGHDDMLMVPNFLVPASGEFYALTVEGDSMIGAGINDGDTVVVERTDTARNGEIVVAFIHDENMATLKTLRMAGDIIILEAENPAYEKQRYPADAVTIQGKLSALMRSY